MHREVRGYNRQQVDEFLGRCLASGIDPSLDKELMDRQPQGTPVTAEEVRNVRFTRELRGYNQLSVDSLLDVIEGALS